MRIFLAPGVKKSVQKELAFVKSNFLAIANFNFSDLAKFGFLDLTKFDFFDSANFTIVDRFSIYPAILIPISPLPAPQVQSNTS